MSSPHYWRCLSCGMCVNTTRMICPCGTSALLLPYPPQLVSALAVPTHQLGPAPKAPDPPKPPHLTAKVLGFRQWRLDGYKLHSAAVPASWKIGPNKAKCLYPELHRRPGGALAQSLHTAPDPHCDCGLYAWHEPPPAWEGDPGVCGAVLAWGRIQVHADGFRAQYAEPVILAYSRGQTYGQVEDARTIAGEMGVPFVELSELEARARELGSPIAPELRPARTPRLAPPGAFLSASAGAAPMASGGAFATSIWGGAGVVLTPPPPPVKRHPSRRWEHFVGGGSAGAASANLGRPRELDGDVIARILEMDLRGRSQRTIAQTCGIGREQVRGVLRQARRHKVG